VHFSQILHANFREQANKKAQRLQQLKSLDKIEANRAQTQLVELENKIKSRNDAYLTNVEETRQKA
jgi:hypothetical protein